MFLSSLYTFIWASCTHTEIQQQGDVAYLDIKIILHSSDTIFTTRVGELVSISHTLAQINLLSIRITIIEDVFELNAHERVSECVSA